MRWQVSWLASHRLSADLPGCPVAEYWQTDSPLTVAGAAAASSVFALTAFPFDPRREPSRRDRNGEKDGRQPVGAMQALAPEHVVYAGTASKTLSPAVRLAWLVLPD